MQNRYGVILLTSDEIIIRVYAVTETAWNLSYFHNTTLKYPDIKSVYITEQLADFFLTSNARGVGEWKICAQALPLSVTKEVAEATSIPVERLIPARQQELLCKGMFTELW